MMRTYQWEGLPTPKLGDGRLTDTEGIVCYTDGSKIEESPVGFGYLVRSTASNHGEHGHIGTHSTVFQGEVFAIQRASNYLQTLPGNEDINFYVDNQAAILSLTKPECDSTTVYRCRESLTQLCRRHKVVINWVQAHAGFDLNEKVDKLAKLGTQSDNAHIVPRPLKTSNGKYEKKQPVGGMQGGARSPPADRQD